MLAKDFKFFRAFGNGIRCVEFNFIIISFYLSNIRPRYYIWELIACDLF